MNDELDLLDSNGEKPKKTRSGKAKQLLNDDDDDVVEYADE